MDFSFNLDGGNLGPRSIYNRARDELNRAVDNATLTVSGFPDLRIPDRVELGGDGSVTAQFSDNGLLYIALAVAALVFLGRK